MKRVLKAIFYLDSSCAILQELFDHMIKQKQIIVKNLWKLCYIIYVWYKTKTKKKIILHGKQVTVNDACYKTSLINVVIVYEHWPDTPE